MFYSAFLLSVFLVALTTADESSKCPLITTPEAPLWKSFFGSKLYEHTGREKLLKRIGALRLSKAQQQCMGAWNLNIWKGWDFYTKECKKGLSYYQPELFSLNPFKSDADRFKLSSKAQEFTNQMDNFIENPLMKMNHFLNFIQTLSVVRYQDECTNLKESLSSCLKKTMIPLFLKHVESHECCHDYVTEFEQNMNQKINKDTLMTLLDLIQDLACATKNEDSEAVPCAYAYSKALLNSKFLMNIMSFVQVPKYEETCKSLDKKPFKNYLEFTQLPLDAKISCCGNYFDRLVRKLRTYPGFRQYMPDGLLKNGSCMRLTEVQAIQELLKGNPQLAALLGALCVHIPNGIEKSCRFQGTCSGITDEMDIPDFDFNKDITLVYNHNATETSPNATKTK